MTQLLSWHMTGYEILSIIILLKKLQMKTIIKHDIINKNILKQ